jgi:hypothetical protein
VKSVEAEDAVGRRGACPSYATKSASWRDLHHGRSARGFSIVTHVGLAASGTRSPGGAQARGTASETGFTGSGRTKTRPSPRGFELGGIGGVNAIKRDHDEPGHRVRPRRGDLGRQAEILLPAHEAQHPMQGPLGLLLGRPPASEAQQLGKLHERRDLDPRPPPTSFGYLRRSANMRPVSTRSGENTRWKSWPSPDLFQQLPPVPGGADRQGGLVADQGARGEVCGHPQLHRPSSHPRQDAFAEVTDDEAIFTSYHAPGERDAHSPRFPAWARCGREPRRVVSRLLSVGA